MVVKCEVKFDNNHNAIFFAGQTLSGVVELTIDKPKKIRGLVLKIEGYAKVEWTESERTIREPNDEQSNSSSRRSNVIYSGREDYMSSTSYLIGSPQGNQIEMAPGQYRYTFQSMLPTQLPTSCETNFGSIRYLVNVVLDRPFKFDLTYKTAFTVIKQLDLNYENPSLSIPLKMDTSKTYCCWICKTKPLLLSASIPQSGYVPGEQVNVFVEVRNDSRFDVIDVVVSLIKIIKYNSQIPKEKTKEEILTETEVRYGLIKKESRKTFHQTLIIPPVPPSNSSYCRVLNVSYEVEIRCNVVKYSSDPFIRLPIIVGTVPLAPRRTPLQPTAPSVSALSTLNSGYDALFNSFMIANQLASRNTSSELPPPSYAEAVYTQEEGREIELSEVGEHSMGSRPYHPMYPFYNFDNSQAQSSNQSTNGPPVPRVEDLTIHEFNSLVLCNIEFDKEGVGFSGQILSGTIEITNEERRNISWIFSRVEGYAKCQWPELEGTEDRGETVFYAGNENYIHIQNDLVGRYNGSPVDFREGNYKFKINIEIPYNLPTSLESKYGYIRYQIVIKIVRPTQFNIQYTVPFTVIKPFDLNHSDPALQIALKEKVPKSFFSRFSIKNIHMTAEIPFSGYVSGQTIHVSIIVDNESIDEVTEITAELIKMICYTSETPTIKMKKREERVAMTKHQGVPSKKRGEAFASLAIPIIPPTNVGTCRTIQVSYEVRVIANVSDPSKNLIIVLPITIGTVPLVSSYEYLYSSKKMTMTDTTYTIQTLLYKEADEIPHQESDEEDDDGLKDQLAYVPKYPVFNFTLIG